MNRSTMNLVKILTIVWVTACLAAWGAVGGAGQASTTQQAVGPNPDLVGRLTQELNVTPKQATGGAGAIFGLVKKRLSPTDFSKVAAAVPGMNGFLKAAPAAKAEPSPLDSVTAMAPGGVGDLGSVASSFQLLGLSPAMVGQFVPVLENYISSKGGSNVASLFAGAVK